MTPKSENSQVSVARVVVESSPASVNCKKIELFLPIKTVSEANCSEHWSKKSTRHKNQQRALRAYLSHIKAYPLPCTITFKRVGARLLDPDNLQMAHKWLRDELSDIILGNIYQSPKNGPNSVLDEIKSHTRLKGRNDDDSRLKWKYDQMKGAAHGTWLTIETTLLEKLDN